MDIHIRKYIVCVCVGAYGVCLGTMFVLHRTYAHPPSQTMNLPYSGRGPRHNFVSTFIQCTFDKSIEVVVLIGWLSLGRQAQPCLFHRGPLGVTLIQGGLLVGRPHPGF